MADDNWLRSTDIPTSMTLSIFSSNRVETLQQNLCQQLNRYQLSDPLATEVVVVPTYAMARWLNLRIAGDQGIAANFDYPLPTAWVWRLAVSILDELPEQDPLQAQKSGWKIFELLPSLLDKPSFESLEYYLREDDSGIKRWQLATRIGQVFEGYQQYRPEKIRDWSSGKGDDWQAQVWRTLTRELGQNHRVAVIERLIEALHGPVDAEPLPERVSLFAHSSLPPAAIRVIHALSRHIDIRLYQHSPTDQYWADLKNKKSLARLRLQDPEQAQYFESGNSLLASWGRQGQALQDLLLDLEGEPVYESESYRAPGRSTLLQTIQQNIFRLEESAVDAEPDASFSVQVCHSPMRECQVLKDSILRMLDRSSNLNPEDVLVMVPEISRYAPYIEAVFGHRDNQANLNWNLSDITLADEHPLVLIFLQLLRLPTSRFTLSEVLSYLEIEEIRLCFAIDDQALADIHELLGESRVRWGIDGDHKSSLGLPPTGENTWQQAGQRIFAGYALGEVEFWEGIAPLAEVDAGRAQSMGKFWLLFERLRHWRERLQTACSSEQWQLRLNRLLAEFFVEPADRDGRLQTIRDAINELSLGSGQELSSSLLLHWMEQQLASRELQGRLFSGGITFCGMRPMRSLPFRVICLLGMNDGVFPRREERIEFDAMADHWRPGDPLKGDEDRYLMLETLLCARETLYISYCGRSLKDNSECQPSVLLRELLDFIDESFAPGAEAGKRFSEGLIQSHPMQAFAAGNFASPGSYDAFWCRVANRLRGCETRPVSPDWRSDPLPGPEESSQQISLDELRRFLQDPIRHFFNRRLRLWLRAHTEDPDEESFSLDSLESWDIRQRLADDWLDGRDIGPALLSAQGRLPHGPAAISSFEAIESELLPLLESLQAYRGVGSQSLAIDCRLDRELTLNGSVEHYFDGQGLMHFNSGKLKGKQLLALWLDHLALCASRQYQPGDRARLVSRDISLQLSPLDADQALARLVDYADLFKLGLTFPLPIFPAASFAWSNAETPDKSMREADRAWQGNPFQAIPGDRDNAYVRLALRANQPSPIEGEAFAAFAERLYGKALTCVEFL